MTATTHAVARRIDPLASLRHTLTLAWRNLAQIRHNPFELVDLSLQPIMFVLLFTYVFGGAIAGSTHAYLQFALPGIIVQNALFLTLNTAIGLNNDITKGVFDRFRSLPIARSAPLAGRVVSDLVRQVWSIAMMIGVGMILGFRIETSPLGLLAAAALLAAIAFAMSWPSVLIGLLASSVEKVQVFAFSIMMPLTFTSNAFVQTKTMPGWLQAWVKVNPVSQLSDALRGLLVGGPAMTPTLKALAWALGIMIVFAPLAAFAYRRRV